MEPDEGEEGEYDGQLEPRNMLRQTSGYSRNINMKCFNLTVSPVLAF